MDRSRSSPDDPVMAHFPKVPAASSVLSRRASGSAQPRNSPQAESSDTSMEDRGRGRQRAQPGPGPSSSSSYRPDNPIDLSASQASFLAGAAVTHAHQASQIANNAADVALSSQLELQHAQRVATAIHAGAVQQQADFAQAATTLREQATRAFLVQQEEARAAIEQRDHNFQLLQLRAQQQVQGVIQEAEREIVANREAVAERAQQWVTDNVRPLQNQINVGNQQLADRDSQLQEREIRIARLQAQLDAIQRQNAYDVPVASPTPVPESPITVHTDLDAVDGSINPFAHDLLDGSATPTNTPPRQPTGMSPRESPLIQLMPVGASTAQPVSSSQNMSSVPSIPISFGPPVTEDPPPGLPLSSSAIIPLQSGLVQANPHPALGAEQLNVGTAASGYGSNEDRISALQDQVSQLMQALHAQTQLVAQLQAARTPVPIAPPAAPPALTMGGAALSAPSGSRRGNGGSAPLPQQVLPPGLPPLPLANLGNQGTPFVFNIGSQRSRHSGSSESSSDSDAGPRPPSPPQCRICGEFHNELDCPYLTMNDPAQPGYAPDQGSDQPRPGSEVRDYADEEDETIRVKSLNDLTFPNPPENAGQARGYVNQVLMAIGKLQKTPGSDVYQWAQECLSVDEATLKADPRFPRTDREIASKLIKTCRKGRFGLIFQQMVESERLSSGSMPCGRVMLRTIFKYFQLERDRIGMLGERNLLSLRIAGNTHADLEAFRDKYIYVMSTIPLEDLPREQTLFNHLIDELERCSVMTAKVQKAREAPLTSHRRTTNWLWGKVELALQLDQQRKNRLEFDKQLKLKPADGYAGTTNTKIAGAPAASDPKGGNPKAKISGAPAPKNANPKSKAEKDKKVEAAPAPHGKPKAKAKPKAKGAPTGPPPKAGANTPRSVEAQKAANMTPAQKARTPCMFYAYNSCKAKQCAFLHSATEKYKGPPPRALAKAKGSPKVAANMAHVTAGTAAVPIVDALPAKPTGAIPWLWDTAAGRHLIGRQALTPHMKSYLQQSPNPVAFATGGGSQAGQESIAFDGSKLLEGEEVYVLKECPPAQSIGKTVIDKGYMFVWDPRENVPYLIAPENINRCKLKVPRNARICASRVVEYVPQYDEHLSPRAFVPADRLAPVSTAVPAERADDAVTEYTPSFADEDVARLAEVAEAESPDEPPAASSGSRDGLPEGAAPSAPPKSLDDKLLVELGDGVPFKDDVLKKEATSPQHLLTHYPKNPYCPLCHIAKDTAMRVSHIKDGKSDDGIDPPKEPFEQLATDDVILAKGSEHFGTGIGGVKTHHVIRDLYSGARVAYPMSKRDIESHAKNFRHYVGLRAGELATRTIMKMDEAQELEQAAHQVGFIPETSLPNRWPHNSILERDIREEKECCRVIHLQSGLPYEYHTYSFPYACLSMSFDRPALCNPDKTQWEAITREKFNGIRLCFGQLVYYRKKHPTKRTLEPNMAPGLFLGWRIDSGLRYRNVTRILDYQEFRTRGSSCVADVPEPELFIPDGDPYFPIGFSKHQALVRGDDPEDIKLPEIALKDVPFPPDGGIASPSTPGPKSRSVYITLDRIIKFKETPGCKGCTNKTRYHTPECRARFQKLVDEEKELLEKSKAESAIAEPPSEARVGPPEELPDVLPPEEPSPVEGIFDDGDDEPKIAVPYGVSGVATVPKTSHSCVDLSRDNLPVFGAQPVPACPAVNQPTKKKNNRRQRRAMQKSLKPNAKSTLFEFACSLNSQLGLTSEQCNINHIGLCREHIDLGDENQCSQLDYQIEESAKTAPPHLWSSIPCTSGSPWQYINRKRGGAAFTRRLARQLKESRRLFQSFSRRAELVLKLGGTVSFEWPRHSTGWKRPDVVAFFDAHPEFLEANFDGCAVGLRSKAGNPIKKPWRVRTTSQRVYDVFHDKTCSCTCPHEKCEGAETARSAMYPSQMTYMIAQALFPSKCVQQHAPAMPCHPLSEEVQEHREVEQHLKHISPLSGYEDFALAVETDPTVNSLVAELLDHDHLLAAALQVEDPHAPSTEIQAMVTKLLSRAEMLSNPKALEAVKAEADGLLKAGTWSLDSVREKEDVRAEAKKTGVSVHFGQLMTIASIKFYELAQHLQKMKGRIVYRGDCARDEHGAAAVYQELGANPTSVQGLNACLAYGSLPGHSASAADAVKAYVQALLSSKYKTWIELPPELRPKHWRDKFVKPVVLLVKALYGHPDAGGLWEQHLKKIIKNLGGQEIPEYPGNFFFPETKLLLSTYVDDLTLAGPSEAHEPFWTKLTSVVDLEPPEPIYRILGRNHLIMPMKQAEGHEECAAFRAQQALVFDMFDYAHQTVDLYKSITNVTNLKHAATPFVPDGSVTIEDEEAKGELAPNACKILMKALWLGRLARPDIIKPINDLATKVQSWSRGDDKRLLRLIQYINSTPQYRLVGTVQDSPTDLELQLYVDADFAGDRLTGKSTSGGFLVLTGPNTFFPLAWVSKRQTSTSRSTTESEVVSLAHSLYQEGLPSLQLWELLLDRPVTLRIMEDNQATILVVRKGYSPKLRHITRTHKVNLSGLSEVFRDDTVTLEYCQTDKQAADIFTKSLPPQKWGSALRLLGVRTDLCNELKGSTEGAAPSRPT